MPSPEMARFPAPHNLPKKPDSGSLKSMVFGGEGLFLATLQGHGTVWLQSLPFSRMADRIIAHAPSSGGKDQGEGSVLGGIGRMIN